MHGQLALAAGIDGASGMNPHATQPASPIHMVKTLWSNRKLLDQLARRDVAGRYKGAAIGVAWSFLTPLLML